MADEIARITNYLANGGLFNPELMEHQKVSDLLQNCRDAIAERDARIAALEAELGEDAWDSRCACRVAPDETVQLCVTHAKMEQDARRYRWIRDSWYVEGNEWPDVKDTNGYPEELDAAIDEAMSNE